MNPYLRLLWVATVLLVLTACASKKEPEPPPPAKAEAPAAENLVQDKTVMPGVRVGPVFLDMPLRQMIRAPSHCGWWVRKCRLARATGTPATRSRLHSSTNILSIAVSSWVPRISQSVVFMIYNLSP